MTVAAAMTELRGRVGPGWELRDRPNVEIEGQMPTVAVYHVDTTMNIHGETTDSIAAQFTVPAGQQFVSGENLTRAQDAAAALLQTLVGGTTLGGLLIYWVVPPAVSYDPGETMAVATLTVTVCERYPRR